MTLFKSHLDSRDLKTTQPHSQKLLQVQNSGLKTATSCRLENGDGLRRERRVLTTWPFEMEVIKKRDDELVRKTKKDTLNSFPS